MTVVSDRAPLLPELSPPAPPTPEPAGVNRPAHAEGKRRSPEGVVVVVLTGAVYLAVAFLLAFKYGSFSQDAVARMANGFYVLYSRDPHLASVGFVWEPLQSISDLVFLIPNHLWPALSNRDMAGAFVSVIGMVGAVHQLRCALLEWGVRLAPRLVLTALFALDPMILYYSGNGMSEGLYLFTLVASTRYLLRWIRTKSLSSLAYAAVALGFCDLTRNEAAGAAVAGMLVVVFVSYSQHSQHSQHAQSSVRHRLTAAFHDGTIFFLPFLVAAAGWAIASFVIVGQFFPQFTSIYGNSSQEAFLTHKHISGRISYELHAITSLAPLFALILVAALVVAAWRRDPRILAPIGVIGGALAFDVAAYLQNSIENFYRYFITVVPLEVLLVGSLFAALPALGAVGAVGAHAEAGSDPPRRGDRHPLAAVTAVLVCLVLLIPAYITTGAAMFNPNIGPQESTLLGPIFHRHLSATDKSINETYDTVTADSNDISRLHLPNGSIVFDNFTSCAPNIITTIDQPKVFVIPNDRDFRQILFDPIAFHTHYILEADPKGSPITATNIQYPTLWSTGDGFTKQVLQIPARSICPEFRLFHVIGHTNTPAG
jgi:hypothetical protein